jgi:hypothetical protein
MKMIDLKQKPPSKKDSMKEPCCVDGYDKYPWGLRLNFDTDVIEKLGLDLKTLKVGGSIVIKAKGSVIEVSETERVKGKPSKRLEIQIEQIGLEDSNSFEGAFKNATGKSS